MKKVYFVGIHYKDGFEALDSRTKSGHVIDKVITELDGLKCYKTNLFPTSYLPDQIHWKEFGLDFEIDPKAIYVLLGNIVQKSLDDVPCRINAYHPSYAIRKGITKDYIDSLTKKIQCTLTDLETK